MARTAQAAAMAPTSTYVDHRSYVLGVLARRCGWLDHDDHEAVFHDAYALVLEKDRDGTIDLDSLHPLQVRAFLVRTATNKALDEGKRAWRKRTVSLSEHDDHDEAFHDDRGSLEDVVAGTTDRARLLEIISELPERQQVIVKLRYFFDREPTEIQQFLDVTERSYRRELERAMRHIARRFELVVSGTFCDSRRSVILALVAGIAGPSRADAARRHLATCSACASWAAELRTDRRSAATASDVQPGAHVATRIDRTAVGARAGARRTRTRVQRVATPWPTLTVVSAPESPGSVADRSRSTRGRAKG